MKLLSDYYRTVTEPIYIFAAGPSLLKVDPEIFRNKLCFGINYVFQIIPYINFLFIHEFETFEIIQHRFPNHRIVIPMSLNKNLTYDHKTIENDKCIYYHKYKYDLSSGLDIDLKWDAYKQIFAFTTTTHSAIHIAAYMGAKTIYLIGVDYKDYSNGQVHFKTCIDHRYDNQQWNVYKKHQEGDKYITRKLSAKGINVYNLSNQILYGGGICHLKNA